MKQIKVHKGKKYLMWEDGTPFFYLGDTAWELFHRTNRQEAEEYLGLRAQQGFHVIQAAVLAELNGIFEPNRYGRVPFLVDKENRVAIKPDEKGEYTYWDHIDYILEKADQLGMFIGMLPCWGDKWNQSGGAGPEIFKNPQTAFDYGRWLGNRYYDRWNIIWILGGDRPIANSGQEMVIDAMAAGIKEADCNHLMTFHPGGASCSTDFLRGKEYIDFHSCQSGHGLEGYESWKYIDKMQKQEEKPCLDLEPRYEDHPACFRADYGVYWDDSDVRANGYWNLFQGACGCVYGNNAVWCFRSNTNEYYRHHWKEALKHPGASQMRHMEKLRLSRPFFEFRPAPELLEEDQRWFNGHVSAARGEKYGMVYSPLGKEVHVHLERLSSSPVTCMWFHPSTGEFMGKKIYPSRPVILQPPTPGMDWVAVLDVL